MVLHFLLPFILSSLSSIGPISAEYEYDWVCNNGTNFSCVCYTGDGSQRNNFPDCYSLIKSENMTVFSFTIKGLNLTQRLQEPEKTSAYERFFKGRTAAVISDRCVQQSNDCPGTILDMDWQRIVFLRVGCTDKKHVNVQFVVRKSPAFVDTSITNQNTLSPERFISIMTDDDKTMFSRYMQIKNDKDIDYAWETIYLDPKENKPFKPFGDNFGMSLVLIIIAGILAIIYMIAIFKVIRDHRERKRREKRLNNLPKPGYGATDSVKNSFTTPQQQAMQVPRPVTLATSRSGGENGKLDHSPPKLSPVSSMSIHSQPDAKPRTPSWASGDSQPHITTVHPQRHAPPPPPLPGPHDHSMIVEASVRASPTPPGSPPATDVENRRPSLSVKSLVDEQIAEDPEAEAEAELENAIAFKDTWSPVDATAPAETSFSEMPMDIPKIHFSPPPDSTPDSSDNEMYKEELDSPKEEETPPAAPYFEETAQEVPSNGEFGAGMPPPSELPPPLPPEYAAADNSGDEWGNEDSTTPVLESTHDDIFAFPVGNHLDRQQLVESTEADDTAEATDDVTSPPMHNGIALSAPMRDIRVSQEFLVRSSGASDSEPPAPQPERPQKETKKKTKRSPRRAGSDDSSEFSTSDASSDYNLNEKLMREPEYERLRESQYSLNKMTVAPVNDSTDNVADGEDSELDLR